MHGTGMLALDLLAPVVDVRDADVIVVLALLHGPPFDEELSLFHGNEGMAMTGVMGGAFLFERKNGSHYKGNFAASEVAKPQFPT
jgi:hypothetical protein